MLNGVSQVTIQNLETSLETRQRRKGSTQTKKNRPAKKTLRVTISLPKNHQGQEYALGSFYDYIDAKFGHVEWHSFYIDKNSRTRAVCASGCQHFCEEDCRKKRVAILPLPVERLSGTRDLTTETLSSISSPFLNHDCPPALSK